jgi:hypothetical protein
MPDVYDCLLSEAKKDVDPFGYGWNSHCGLDDEQTKRDDACVFD